MAEYAFALTDRQLVAEETMAFWFSTAGSNFTFEAGQNIDIFLPGAPASGASSDQMHTFSLASAPHHTDHFRITTRMRNSAFKNALKSLPLGTTFRCVGPNGNMVLHEDTKKPAVFLAGGIGITPFRSMIEWATQTHRLHQLYLFYGNRTQASTAYHAELVDWSRKFANFHYVSCLTDEQPSDPAFRAGRIDIALIRQYFADLAKPIFYIAGPPGMVSAMRTMLTDAGVSRDQIKLESFSGY